MTAVEPSRHPATAWVNLDRIRENFRAIRNHAGARAVIPVLKADAYGHGAIAVARALDPMGVAMFAVAAAKMALEDAGLTAAEAQGANAGVNIGTALGGTNDL